MKIAQIKIVDPQFTVSASADSDFITVRQNIFASNGIDTSILISNDFMWEGIKNLSKAIDLAYDVASGHDVLGLCD